MDEREKNQWRVNRKAEVMVDKRIKKTLGEKNKHNGQQTAEGKNTTGFGTLLFLLPLAGDRRKEERRRGEGGEEEG